MQREFTEVAKIEVELTQEKEMDKLPNRPSKLINISNLPISISSSS